jgi:proline iminopeptidase
MECRPRSLGRSGTLVTDSVCAGGAPSIYEGACSNLLSSPDTMAAFGEDPIAPGLARIEAHFFLHNVIPPEH